MEKILLKNIDLVTVDQTKGVIKDGYLAINDGKIQALGKSQELKEEDYAHYRVITGKAYGKRLVALPGFIQTHVHTSQALGRGLADDVDLITWTRKRIWPYEAALTEEDVYVSAQLSMAEMIKSGTTSFCEAAGEHPDAIAKSATDAGLRGTICLSTMDIPGDVPKALQMTTEQALQKNTDLVEKYKDHDRISGCYNILNLFLSSPELWQEMAKLSQKNQVYLQTHLAESKDEVAFVKEKYGLSPVAFLKKMGALSPRLLAAHVVHVDDEDLDSLEENQVKILHCPAAGLRIAGTARIPEMVDRGMTISLGTNSPPCNNRMSMLDEMWLAGIMHNAFEDNPQTMPAKTVLEMATLGGAKTLGLDKEIGSLTVGKKADVTILDLNNLYTTPTHDLLSTLVYQANSHAVDTVIADGRLLLRGGELTTINENWLIEEAERRAQNIVKRAQISF